MKASFFEPKYQRRAKTGTFFIDFYRRELYNKDKY